MSAKSEIYKKKIHCLINVHSFRMIAFHFVVSYFKFNIIEVMGSSMWHVFSAFFPHVCHMYTSVYTLWEYMINDIKTNVKHAILKIACIRVFILGYSENLAYTCL